MNPRETSDDFEITGLLARYAWGGHPAQLVAVDGHRRGVINHL
jgi:hypothetical protein